MAISLLWGFIVTQMGVKRGFPADLIWCHPVVADTRFPVPYYPTGAMFIAISTFMANGP